MRREEDGSRLSADSYNQKDSRRREGKGKEEDCHCYLEKIKKTKKLLKQIKSIEVQYSTNRQFTRESRLSKRVGKNKTKAVLKLKAKTTYYIRVRYVGADGTSKWSKIRKVKTK